MPQAMQSAVRRFSARYYLDEEWDSMALLVPVEALKRKQREALLYLKTTVGLETIGDYWKQLEII
ncbi:hypothetical protein HJG54_24590 [Leptolyngbya sp. NK1-12]|uniref:Uncharacterized protein n=1 Tax=Leptolyngbya sp. NK1-12 TaxID=2547451 RepID=A0AA96WNC7_9CYAN|nr:hypothetical protein [Leptolyngbya sp. NK1-12]WNZ25701.1 hypothetical protein HJG54_24590 [Leptolyngbya sp. NK1-12]